MVGGRNGSIDSPAFLVKSVFIYNVPTNTWTVGPVDALASQSDTVAGSFGGKVRFHRNCVSLDWNTARNSVHMT